MNVKNSFVHLHTHTEFSTLDGAARIPTLVERAKDYGMSSLAQTDHGTLSGSLQFYKECQLQGLKPVLGCEIYTCIGDHKIKTSELGRPASPHLTLLAQNRIGFQNLIKLTSVAFTEGFYYKPRCSRELLKQYSEGIICLSGCISGEFSRQILAGDLSKAIETAEWFRSIYGDRYNLEVMAATEHQRQTLEPILEISNKLGIPAVCTSDVHYVDKEDHELQDVMICISTGAHRNDPGRMKMTDHEYYLKSPEEMYKLIPERPDIFRRSQEIADSVDIKLELGKKHFPSFQVPDKTTPVGVLRGLCLKGLRWRYKKVTPKLLERLEHELYVIDKLSFSTYFLIIEDFVRYARLQNIRCVARGSAAGCIVCYALGISNVCPLEYGLLFERFLDLSRKEPPDIDVDVEKYRREEVISYIRSRYGEESVCQIGTFGTMAARAAIKDVARVHDIPHEKTQIVCDMISELPGTTIDDTLRDNPSFSKFYDTSKSGKYIIDLARRLEGMIRNTGKHAAAIVIAPGKMTNYIPVMRSTGGDSIVTQWAMEDVEAAGIIKFDCLGLKTLDVVSRTMARVGLTEIPMGDEESFKILEKGQVEGVFQLSGWGMKKTLMQLKPKSVEEISHVIAIFRPGPIDSGMLETYIRRRNGTINFSYAHPLLQEVLGSTVGIAVYQEQLMNLAHRVAGIPLSDAYSLIKVISKKKKDKVREYKDRFVLGAKERGLAAADIETLWDQIEAAGRYSFNKSHSISYALLSYQTAYLKTHYPAEFMSSVLTYEIPTRNFTSKYGDDVDAGIKECKKMGINVTKPDINTGGVGFYPTDERTIAYALNAIKGVGEKAVLAIQQARAAGLFTDLGDFCERVENSLCTKGAIVGLINAGAFDKIVESRAEALDRVNDAVKIGKKVRTDKERGQKFINFGG